MNLNAIKYKFIKIECTKEITLNVPVYIPSRSGLSQKVDCHSRPDPESIACIRRLNILCALLLTVLLIFTGCKDKKKGETKSSTPVKEETLIKINKYLVNQDADKIKGYVKRRNWNMTQTETGLWYMIYQKGNGEAAKIEKIATIKYNISLLDGTPCYSSDSLGLKKFRIGKGGVERGLEEGILYMHAGDKARFIMPPHLAHGLTGDSDKIPPRSIIVYDVELVQISD